MKRSCLVLFSFLILSAWAQSPDKLTGPYLGQKLPGTAPEPFAPGIVASTHGSVTISRAGDEIYWSDGPIYMTTCKDGVWTKPEALPFTREEGGDGPKLSPDDRKLYFNSDRPRWPGDPRRERIWCAERTAAGWGDPVPLGPEVNDEHLHWQVSVDAGGTLYFGSERRGSKGRDDVFAAEPRDGGGFAKPFSLDAAVNSGAHEGSPFVAPDGRYLIFLRDSDLWVSFRGKNGRWESARRLDAPAYAVCPYVSPDERFFFFLKLERDAVGLYWMDASGLGLKGDSRASRDTAFE